MYNYIENRDINNKRRKKKKENLKMTVKHGALPEKKKQVAFAILGAHITSARQCVDKEKKTTRERKKTRTSAIDEET